ncbi:ABC transporter ATP-binding protein [Leifsonia poae]|uniref:ABC transporter ATP-binding protein n=1 Tax=Leifsonia poae TaxID=110933 RepID=UPI001CBE85A3|nr:ABC transporter ATP-binding protein [Leifsonia poae]
MTAALEAVALTKAYRGRKALDAVDLTVEEGSIFGFLGPNGAGKTTTLRLITGLARPTSGTVRVLGENVSDAGNTVRAQLGFLPDVPAFYEWMTAEEFMLFAGGLFGLERRVLTERTGMLLDAAGLSGVTTRIGGYSRGMRQRLGIAQALVNAPRLLLLDEPTSALDPIGRKDVLDMIGSLRGRTTIFFSTHILGDVERVCDSVAILDHGRVLTQAPIPELKARYGRHRITLEVSDGADALAAVLATRPWAASVAPGAPGAPGVIELTVTDVRAAQHDIPGLVAAQNAGLVRLEAGELGLEDVFVELIGEAAA